MLLCRADSPCSEFLSRFRLPSEAQVIDRFMVCLLLPPFPASRLTAPRR